ncbi:hypothetical protein HHL22_04030 [Hymenobacter sp. RP-2-7]|uniref:Uncharacterized protein n=1 Tax=Hymenobacter polaris TaxID=2682546 RepID=A0A7Y0AC00_9BACT|nr:hypothetical protein [Hymenobacter polaris]NML64367.1 hypothetical protein [Hymenobacter polaris]
MQRLTRLIQEMGDRGLEPEAFEPASTLRPRYLQLATQATRLAQAMGFAEGESAEYISNLLVDSLRTSSRAERRERMTLQEALGD